MDIFCLRRQQSQSFPCCINVHVDALVFFKIASVSFRISISSSMSWIFAFSSSISLEEAGCPSFSFPLALSLGGLISADAPFWIYVFRQLICLPYYIPVRQQLFAQSRRVQSGDAGPQVLFQQEDDADAPECCSHKSRTVSRKPELPVYPII